jgi:hypothetical protein
MSQKGGANMTDSTPERSEHVPASARWVITIVIPTYNRAHCLETLLQTLCVELKGLEGQVAVIIGDNASTDRTPDLAREFSVQWRDTLVLRHDTNVGVDENFCRCVEKVASSYFWIIGDDDLPGTGVVRALISLLDRTVPDLVYLSSRWGATLDRTRQSTPVTILGAALMDRGTFARCVHVWTTFISGNVIRRELASDGELRQFAGTNLVQLSWMFEALKRGRRFVYVMTPSVFATSGNTAGYSILRVFGENFQRITREAFSGNKGLKSVGAAIIVRTSIGYLPSIVWKLKRGTQLDRFDKTESVAAALGPELSRSVVYRVLIRPLENAPPGLGRLLLVCSRVLARLLWLYDLAYGKLTGRVIKL